MKKKVLIEGMSCGHCVNHVKEALSDLDGVKDVDVSLEGKYAIIEANSDIRDEQIKFAVEEAGYDVIGIEIL